MPEEAPPAKGIRLQWDGVPDRVKDALERHLQSKLACSRDTMALIRGIVAAVIEQEDSPLRWERFCIELYREAGGVELVPTSRTRDLGRDARSIRVEGRIVDTILAASLAVALDRKVEEDLTRLRETTSIKTIVYCTARDLTEEALDKIAVRIREIHGSLQSVVPLSQVQLVELAMRFEEVTRRHYGNEIQNIEKTLLVERRGEAEPETIGLRLALMTRTGDDARALRAELSRRLVLEALYPGKRVTLQRELGDILLGEARASGEPRQILRERLLNSEDPEYSARVVVEVLDRMAVTPEAEQEVQRLRQEVEKLREELKRARQEKG